MKEYESLGRIMGNCPSCGFGRRRAAFFWEVAPYQVILSVSVGDHPGECAATARGARIRPRKNPAINPQRWAAMLTCGVDRSNAVWIAMINKIFANRRFACV